MPQVIINNTHLTFSEDTIFITEDMVRPYQNTVTHVTIPEGVTTIGNYAFCGWSGLTHITFPDGLTTIESRAFLGCTGLTSVSFPDGLTTIGIYAFAGCTGLTHITFPDGLTTIKQEAFRNCTGLSHLTFPDGLTTIGIWAFEHCNGLTHLTLPDNLTTIDNCAFDGCTGLTHLIFPDNLTTIESGAFRDCTNLQYIFIPLSLENKDTQYWQDKGIDPARTRIITKTQLQAFAHDKKVDSHTNPREIATLFLVDQGHVPLPQAKEHLNTHQLITKLSLPNLFSLPIPKQLILPGFATYQNLTETQAIILEALAPLGRWAVEAAANPLASWLSWHDMARIWLAKAKAPRKLCPPALQAAQIYRHKDTAKRHDKGYPKDGAASAKASFAMRPFLSQRPRSTHSNHQHPNHADPRTSCTKN